MYRDSQHGLTIDLDGEEGNAYVLIGYMYQYAAQLGLPKAKADDIAKSMMQSDYETLLAVFMREFPMIRLLRNGESLDYAEQMAKGTASKFKSKRSSQ